MEKIIRFNAIDVSYSTGFCTTYTQPDSGRRVYTTSGIFKPQKQSSTSIQKMLDIVDKFMLICSVSNVKIRDKEYKLQDDVTFMEDYAFGRFGGSSSVTTLAELCGIIKYVYYRSWGKEIVCVPPTSIKKFLCGSGRAKKEDIKLHAYKKYGIEFATSDEADAYALCDLGVTAFFNKDDGTKKKNDTLTVVRGRMNL